MIVIETCPKCGHDLIDINLTSYPPQEGKMCSYCGWTWHGKREEEPGGRIVRIPFQETTKWWETAPYQKDCPNIDAIPQSCRNCPNHPSNGGSGICFCILGTKPITCESINTTTGTTIGASTAYTNTTNTSTEVVC